MRYYNVLNNKKQPRIAMAVTNDLVTDRRVLRHAATLREAGCSVQLIGRADLGVRAKNTWRFYAEYNLRLFFRLLRTPCDIVWANDTDTLPAAWLAARLRRKRLVMDSHEIFPEVPELVGRDGVKRVWQLIERCLMPRCDANLTVCQSVADHYKRTLGIDMVVVRNMSSLTPGPSPAGEGGGCRIHCTPLSHGRGAGGEALLLYQGAVNLGRGIDWAIDALGRLVRCRLVVAGVGDLYDQMRAYAASKPWADRIEFLGRLEPDALAALTPQADVGLVMLQDLGLNYRCALPNRVGDFIAAGVPMVVSDMPEMRRVIDAYAIGAVLAAPGPDALADAVEHVLARPKADYDFAAARADFDWNREKKKLFDIVKSVASY